MKRGSRWWLVMASVARPSILVMRGDGLPRYARSDGIYCLLLKVRVRYLAGLGKIAKAAYPLAVTDLLLTMMITSPLTVTSPVFSSRRGRSFLRS